MAKFCSRFRPEAARNLKSCAAFGPSILAVWARPKNRVSSSNLACHSTIIGCPVCFLVFIEGAEAMFIGGIPVSGRFVCATSMSRGS